MELKGNLLIALVVILELISSLVFGLLSAIGTGIRCGR